MEKKENKITLKELFLTIENKEKKKTLKSFDYKRFKEWKREKLLNREKRYFDIVEYACEFTSLINEMKNDIQNYQGTQERKQKLTAKFARIYYCYQLFLRIFSQSNLLGDKLDALLDTYREVSKENEALSKENETLKKEIEEIKKNILNEF